MLQPKRGHQMPTHLQPHFSVVPVLAIGLIGQPQIALGCRLVFLAPRPPALRKALVNLFTLAPMAFGIADCHALQS